MCQCKFALMATAAVFLAQFWHTHCAKMVKIGLKMYFDSGSESLYLLDFCGGGDQDRTDDLLIGSRESSLSGEEKWKKTNPEFGPSTFSTSMSAR